MRYRWLLPAFRPGRKWTQRTIIGAITSSAGRPLCLASPVQTTVGAVPVQCQHLLCDASSTFFRFSRPCSLPKECAVSGVVPISHDFHTIFPALLPPSLASLPAASGTRVSLTSCVAHRPGGGRKPSSIPSLLGSRAAFLWAWTCSWTGLCQLVSPEEGVARPCWVSPLHFPSLLVVAGAQPGKAAMKAGTLTLCTGTYPAQWHLPCDKAVGLSRFASSCRGRALKLRSTRVLICRGSHGRS